MHNCNKTVGKLVGTAYKLCCQASRYDWSWYITHVHNIVFPLPRRKDGPKLFHHYESLLVKLNVKLCTSKDWPRAVHPKSLKKKTHKHKNWEAASLSTLIKFFSNCRASSAWSEYLAFYKLGRDFACKIRSEKHPFCTHFRSRLIKGEIPGKVIVYKFKAAVRN